LIYFLPPKWDRYDEVPSRLFPMYYLYMESATYRTIIPILYDHLGPMVAVIAPSPPTPTRI